MAQIYKYVVVRNKIGIAMILGEGAPSFRNHLAEMCYLYRRARPARLPIVRATRVPIAPIDVEPSTSPGYLASRGMSYSNAATESNVPETHRV